MAANFVRQKNPHSLKGCSNVTHHHQSAVNRQHPSPVYVGACVNRRMAHNHVSTPSSITLQQLPTLALNQRISLHPHTVQPSAHRPVSNSGATAFTVPLTNNSVIPLSLPGSGRASLCAPAAPPAQPEKRAASCRPRSLIFETILTIFGFLSLIFVAVVFCSIVFQAWYSLRHITGC